MKEQQKEIIERIKTLHPEISEKSLNEVIEGISGNSNHITTLETTKPLFTLTAEEVEASNLLYKIADRVLDQKIKESMFDDNLDSGINALKLKSVCQKLLTRIKQWQDENNRTAYSNQN